ncbi:hypothetical protein LRI_0020 [Limosilactobacillus reuteri I5007]|uniref:Uncharacterized protein n=1 Tax=Limosilactobacillus reuteri I5007 TaxID=1340495 RepID=R9WDS7_LIMRT|nr:hypothetical protein LRI_0020 [Limosilactobacillus reuteri I5007]
MVFFYYKIVITCCLGRLETISIAPSASNSSMAALVFVIG